MINFNTTDSMPESGKFIILGVEYGQPFFWEVTRVGDQLFTPEGLELEDITRFKTGCDYLTYK